MTCVRCGQRPRDPNVFLCRDCRDDPAVEAEIHEALRATRTERARPARKWLVANRGWHGHWEARPHEKDPAAPQNSTHSDTHEAVEARG